MSHFGRCDSQAGFSFSLKKGELELIVVHGAGLHLLIGYMPIWLIIYLFYKLLVDFLRIIKAICVTFWFLVSSLTRFSL